ncbi:efflux RND transporter permease subunit, partial [Schleiferiaceae bacterium]|nr:efflux RND transporter permease subunit [Schleiferiaceae bacterium]
MSKQSQTSRSFGLTNWAVDNQVTVMVLTVIILIAGLMSYVAMPAASFPDVDQPTIFVSTPYPGNSPVDIERL